MDGNRNNQEKDMQREEEIEEERDRTKRRNSVLNVQISIIHNPKSYRD